MNRLNGTAPLDVYEIASGATIMEGTLVALNGAGKAVSASDTAGLKVIGAAQRVIDQTVAVADGIFSFANDTGNPVTRTMRGALAYVKDASTVDCKGGTNKIAAGVVIEVYNGEVYVDLRPGVRGTAAAVADCTPAAGGSATSVETQFNALLAQLRAAGIIAKS